MKPVADLGDKLWEQAVFVHFRDWTWNRLNRGKRPCSPLTSPVMLGTSMPSDRAAERETFGSMAGAFGRNF